MLNKVKVGVKHDSHQLEVVGKGICMPAMFTLVIWLREELFLEVPRRKVSDFSGFSARPL